MIRSPDTPLQLVCPDVQMLLCPHRGTAGGSLGPHLATLFPKRLPLNTTIQYGFVGMALPFWSHYGPTYSR